MTLYPYELETIVEERDKELFRDHIIHYFEHYRSQRLDILKVNTNTSTTLQAFLKCATCIIVNCS